MADRIQEGKYYIRFKLKENLPIDLEFEYGEVIPWFKLQGNADQIKSSWNFNKLLKTGKIEILEILKYENKKWMKIK